MAEKQYCVDIMTNNYNTVLYTGVTNDLQRRGLVYKSGKGRVFTSKYNIRKLLYFEATNDIHAAIAREKQIKAGSHKRKFDMINSMHPKWNDLFEEFFK